MKKVKKTERQEQKMYILIKTDTATNIIRLETPVTKRSSPETQNKFVMKEFTRMFIYTIYSIQLDFLDQTPACEVIKSTFQSKTCLCS